MVDRFKYTLEHIERCCHGIGVGARLPWASLAQSFREAPMPESDSEQCSETGQPSEPSNISSSSLSIVPRADNTAVVERLNLQLKRSKAEASYWKRKALHGNEVCAQACARVRALEQAHTYNYCGKRRKTWAKRWNLDVKGGYTMAARRNKGHQSALSLLNTLDLNMHAERSVYHWERLLGSNLMCQRRELYRHMYERLALHHKANQRDHSRTLKDCSNPPLSLGTKRKLANRYVHHHHHATPSPNSAIAVGTLTWEIHNVMGDCTNKGTSKVPPAEFMQ